MKLHAFLLTVALATLAGCARAATPRPSDHPAPTAAPAEATKGPAGPDKGKVGAPGSAPFVLVAQKHNVVQDNKKGVSFYLAGWIETGGQPTLAVACFDRTGQPIKSLRKDLADGNGNLVARVTDQMLPVVNLWGPPKRGPNKYELWTFLPYDAISKAGGPQEIQVRAGLWDNKAGKLVGQGPLVPCRFNPSASPKEIQEAKQGFDREKAAIARVFAGLSSSAPTPGLSPAPVSASPTPVGGWRWGWRTRQRQYGRMEWSPSLGRYEYRVYTRDEMVYEYFYDPNYTPKR